MPALNTRREATAAELALPDGLACPPCVPFVELELPWDPVPGEVALGDSVVYPLPGGFVELLFVSIYASESGLLRQEMMLLRVNCGSESALL